MPTVQVEAELSFDNLIQAVQQLNTAELDQFIQQIVALQAQRHAPSLSKDETDLLLKINQGVPGDIQVRYDELIAKRQAEALTPDEHSELLRLTEQVEAIEVKRVEYLVELARLRQISLTSLMAKLGIQPPVYA
ncbi:MAG: STAS/SEC14 domain-containing protein [Chloroflexi bacterium]|nr:STAS/SEC14 domain-containing protein [Chloroflexota bacterium]